MRKNRFAVIDGDGHITERSKEILEYLGGNYRGTSTEEGWADTFSPFPSPPSKFLSLRDAKLGSPAKRLISFRRNNNKHLVNSA